MIDWTSSMQQTFEYYIVDPGTWKEIKRLDNVTESTITRDSTLETLGSASFNIAQTVGECYIRVYLVVVQNGITEKHPLGTYLVQTPTSSFDGKIRTVSMDAYTPLLELKENPPPLGYSLLKDENIMDIAYRLIREKARAPVVKTSCDITLYNDFVSNTDDNWLTFLSDLIANAKYVFELDEMGRILFAPIQEMTSLQPVWTFNDDNSSILQPPVSMDHDLYGVPNVVEVIFSTESENLYSRVVNDDPNSPTSTVSRGREIVKRITNPDVLGDPTQKQLDEYADRTLRSLSSVEYTLTYTHGYCPVRVGDCVRFNYERAGLRNIKAKVTKQSIKCTPGCPVTETAVFTTKLWKEG